jgi:hypothetical protein
MTVGKGKKSTTRQSYTPWQESLYKDISSAGSNYLAQNPDFSLPDYGGPMVLAPSEAQREAWGGALQQFAQSMDPIDLAPLEAANQRWGQWTAENLVGPQLRADAARQAGLYSSDYERLVAQQMTGMGLNLAQQAQQLRAASAEAARQRQFGALDYLDQIGMAVDPEQAYQQALESARYKEFVRASAPETLPVFMQAFPSGPLTTTKTKGNSWYDTMMQSFGQSFGSGIGNLAVTGVGGAAGYGLGGSSGAATGLNYGAAAAGGG